MSFDKAYKIESEALFRAKAPLEQSLDLGRAWTDAEPDVFRIVYEPKNYARAVEISSGIRLLKHTPRGDVEIMARFAL